MNKFSLGTRIWLPAIAAACVIASMAAFTAVRTTGQARAVQAVQTALREKADLSAEWRGLAQANAARSVAILSSSDAELGKLLKPDVEATSARVSELQKKLDAVAETPEEKAQLDKVAQARTRYVALRQEQTAAHESGPLAPGAIEALREAVKDYDRQQTGYMDIVVQQAQAQGEAQVGDRLRNVGLITAVLLGLCGMLLASAYYTARAILRPLKDAVRATERVAAGDLSVRMDTDRKDEVGDLLRGIGHMVQALRRLISEVSQGANNIQLASAEIATGNTDLSSRTEQAASSLQQTASSMQQLTATVRQSAEAASQANQLASSAAQAAQRGGSVVQEVVANMEDISTSSRRIGDIIGVIDGIAFQTNILALNAAVEAARAGEQGRGFAVVASEVRSLAQRSAEAAKEIKTLIGASVDKVEHGAKLVQDAGATMVDLVGSVRRVSDIIGEITAGAAEQRDGIDQVNIAVGQLDSMTQQNAALVEESAAAADSMKQQAHRLAEVVSTFRLEEAGVGARPPAPAAHEQVAQTVIRAAQTASRTRPAAPAAPIRDNGNTRGPGGDWESF